MFGASLSHLPMSIGLNSFFLMLRCGVTAWRRWSHILELRKLPVLWCVPKIHSSCLLRISAMSRAGTYASQLQSVHSARYPNTCNTCGSQRRNGPDGRLAGPLRLGGEARAREDADVEGGGGHLAGVLYTVYSVTNAAFAARTLTVVHD